MLQVRTALGITIILLLVAGCATTGTGNQTLEADQAETPKSIEEMLELGDGAARAGDLDTAQLNYALAVQEDPNHKEAVYKLAFVHRALGSLGVAESLLRHLHALDPQSEVVLLLLGATLLEAEDLAGAEAAFQETLQVNNIAHEAFNGLGVMFDLRAEHARAQDHFSKAIAVKPRNPKYLNNLGYSFYLSGNYIEAERYFNEALRYDSNYERAWANLALLYSRIDRFADADAAFRKIVKEHQAANNLGYIGLIDGNDQIAYKYLNRAIEISPSYYDLANRNMQMLEN